MFKVQNVVTGEIHKVYGYDDEEGEIYFLVFISNVWTWIHSEFYEPYEDTN